MPDLLNGEQLVELLRSARRSAFRLETRDRYHVGGEPFRRFLAGDPDEGYLTRPTPWSDLTRAAAAEGRPFSRVRVVSVPLSDYCRYALWSAQGNIAAGEDIRYLARDQAAALGLPVQPPLDAWLVDDEHVAVLRFDERDAFVGAELLDERTAVAHHQSLRATAQRASLSRNEFLRSL